MHTLHNKWLTTKRLLYITTAHPWRNEPDINANLTVTPHSTLKMTATEAVETSVTTINSLSQDFTNLDDHPSQTLIFLYMYMYLCNVSSTIAKNSIKSSVYFCRNLFLWKFNKDFKVFLNMHGSQLPVSIATVYHQHRDQLWRLIAMFQNTVFIFWKNSRLVLDLKRTIKF